VTTFFLLNTSFSCVVSLLYPVVANLLNSVVLFLLNRVILFLLYCDDDNLKYNSFEILWGMGDE
jgi:hypothetical protein